MAGRKIKKKIKRETARRKSGAGFDVLCPYCGRQAKLVKAKAIYGKKAVHPEENMYMCANGCDAYVTCREGTDIPKGTLANGELRSMRIHGHKKVEELERTGLLATSEIYKHLSVRLGVKKFHFGFSGEYMCAQAIAELDRLIEETRERQEAAS